MRERLLEILRLVTQASELAADLPRGYREDQIKHALTGEEGEFFGDGLPDWIQELLAGVLDGDCDVCGADCAGDCEEVE
jgi:hypothetical protein